MRYCAVPCRAVPCGAVPCGAVRCRAVRCRAVPCWRRGGEICTLGINKCWRIEKKFLPPTSLRNWDFGTKTESCLALSLPSQIKHKIGKTMNCSATTWTPSLERTHRELSFEWPHFVGQFRSLLVFVKFAFGSERAKILWTSEKLQEICQPYRYRGFQDSEVITFKTRQLFPENFAKFLRAPTICNSPRPPAPWFCRRRPSSIWEKCFRLGFETFAAEAANSVSVFMNFKLHRFLSRHLKCKFPYRRCLSMSIRHMWRLHFVNFSIRTFEPHHAIYTAAVRTCAKFQIVSLVRRLKICLVPY